MNFTGHFSDYFVAFFSGVAVSFTPCTYPVMPLVASFVAGLNTKGTRLMGFFISLLYVLGLAITYSALGVMAALGGKVFGQFQNHPVTFFVVGVILILFGLVMFDVAAFPSFGVSLSGRIRPKNVWTVILFGMASGLVVGPCLTPVLGSLLVYVASKQNIFQGASLLFVFSYGLGTSLILVGTFSGLLSRLPKSGRWLVTIKKVCGFVLLCVGLYFLYKAGIVLFQSSQ